MLAMQLASALAHLHNLQPGVPHGRLSTSIIAVTSAAEISLGRCVSTPVRQDSTPSSKRMHVVDSSSMCSGSLECEPDPLVPEVIKQSCSVPRFVAAPFRRSSTGLSSAFAQSPHSSSSPQAEAIIRRHSVAGPVDAFASCSGTLPLHLRALVTHSTSPQWKRDPESIHVAMNALKLQPDMPSSVDSGSADLAVSSTTLPGVGVVFKVSMPEVPLPNTARESLFEAAEAAVWSRSGVYLLAQSSRLFQCFVRAFHASVVAFVHSH
jgi:hypothetical protein